MARVLLEFVVDNKGAITQVKKVDKALGGVDKSAKTTSKGMTGLSTALKAAGAAFAAMGIARFLKGATQAAADQQRTFTTLAVSMKNVGISYNEVGKELQGTLSALQATTRYGDTDTAKMLNRLITLTGDYNISLKMLRPIMDMAVSRNEDWKTVSDAIGKAIAGNISTLSRYGIILDEATKKMLQTATATERADYFYGLLNERFGGAAQADVGTYAGKMEQLGNYWGDFVETVGTFITTAPGIGSLFSGLIVAIGEWTEWLITAGRLMSVAWNTKWLKLFQGELKLLEHKYLMFIARAMDKTQGLPEWMGGGKKAQGAGINAVILAMQAYDEGLALIAEATDDAIAAGDLWEATVRNQITAVEGLAGTSSSAVDEATGSVKEFASPDFTPYVFEWDRSAAATKKGAAEIAAAFDDAGKSLESFFEAMGDPDDTDVLTEWEILALNIGRMFERTLGDAIYLAFTGRFDEIGDAFQGFFDNVAGMSADAISSSLMEDMAGDEVDWKQVGSTALQGIAAGVAAQGIESGNVAQAAIGGAIAGFMATGNVYGAIAGAVMGAYGAMTAPDSSPPEAAGVFGVRAGTDNWVGGMSTFGDQSLVTSDANLNFRQRAYAAYTEMRQRYFNVLRAFNDPSLFGLVGNEGHGSFSATRQSGSGADVFRLLIETKMPEMFDELFAEAFSQGLGDLGLSDEAFEALSKELGMLIGTDRLTALETYVGALVGLTDLAGDMDWSAIMDVVGMDAMSQFMLGLEAISEAVDVNMMGLDSMTMLERANQAQSIGQMIADARAAEIQMLRQIDQMQKSIMQGWASFDESLLLGGMSESGQLSYLQEQAQAMLAGLQGAGSLEEIDYYNTELMRYLQAIAGMTEQGDWANVTQTWDDWLLEMSAAAQAATESGFDGMRDDIREANQELVDVLRELILVLTSPGALGGGDDTGDQDQPEDPRVPPENPEVPPEDPRVPPPVVNLYIYNTGVVDTAVRSNSAIN